MRGLYTNQKRSIEHFGPMLCSCFFSYSYSVRRGGWYSYSKRSSISILPIGPQVPANRFDQRSASPQFKQPSSTSTVALSTASLSTSTTKPDARYERKDHPGPRSAGPTGGQGSRANRIRSQQAENSSLVGMPQAPGWLVRPEAQFHQLAGGCVVKWGWWR